MMQTLESIAYIVVDEGYFPVFFFKIAIEV